MSDLLPIVAGCKAIIIGAYFNKNNGIAVNVIRYIGTINSEAKKNEIGNWNFKSHNYWLIDKNVIVGNYKNKELDNRVPENILMRIDGYKESELDQAMDLADKVHRKFAHIYNKEEL